MELRLYLSILRRYCWLIAGITLVAGVAALVFDNMRAPTYQVQARLALRPAQTLADPGATINMMYNLGSRAISGTFAGLVPPTVGQEDVRTKVGLSPEAAAKYSFQASVLPDSMLLQVSGSGPDPAILASFMSAVLETLVRDAHELYPTVELVPIDRHIATPALVAPRPMRDVPLAIAVGLAAGVLLSMALAYLTNSSGPLGSGGEESRTDMAHRGAAGRSDPSPR